MTAINPEEYRDAIEDLYKKNHTTNNVGEITTREIKFNELSYFKDEEKEFIIAKYHKEEKDIENPYYGQDEKYTKAERILFCVPLENQKLSDHTLEISALSETSHKYYDRFSNMSDPEVAIQEAMTSASITIGTSDAPHFFYCATEKGYTSLEDSSEIAQIVMQGSKKDKSTALKICDRFLEPNEDTALAVKEKKQNKNA